MTSLGLRSLFGDLGELRANGVSYGRCDASPRGTQLCSYLTCFILFLPLARAELLIIAGDVLYKLITTSITALA